MTPKQWDAVKDSRRIEYLIDRFQEKTRKSRSVCEQYAIDYIERKRHAQNSR